MPTPMSVLFWWSADSTSIGRPSTVPPKSATAIFAASVEPGPPMSAYGPDMSASTPMRIGAPAAAAGRAISVRPDAAAAPSSARRDNGAGVIRSPFPQMRHDRVDAHGG